MKFYQILTNRGMAINTFNMCTYRLLQVVEELLFKGRDDYLDVMSYDIVDIIEFINDRKNGFLYIVQKQIIVIIVYNY